MPKKGKRFSAASEGVDREERLLLFNALAETKKRATAGFDETVEMAVRLGVDPAKAEQMVRGAVTLPSGTGKVRKIIVFAKGEKQKEAEEAGADIVGGDELVEKVSGGFLDFDVAVSTPDMMGQVGKLGRVLGPRGLMPNPKSGTVTFDLAKAIKEIQAGKVEFRVDKTSNIHAPIGKASFSVEALFENAKTIVDQIQKLKPASAKGTYIRSMYVSTTMGPGIRIDTSPAALIAQAPVA